MARNVPIDVACNDPDNGIFAGRAEMIEIGGDVLELVARRDPAPRFVELSSRFRLAGKTWPYVHSKDWYGNWCWNRYWLEADVAAAFVVWLHRRRLFSRECGASELFDRWNRPEPLTVEFMSRFLNGASDD